VDASPPLDGMRTSLPSTSSYIQSSSGSASNCSTVIGPTSGTISAHGARISCAMNLTLLVRDCHSCPIVSLFHQWASVRTPCTDSDTVCLATPHEGNGRVAVADFHSHRLSISGQRVDAMSAHFPRSFRCRWMSRTQANGLQDCVL